MLIAIQGVKLYVYCCTLSEALCSFLYMVGSIMLIAIQGVKLCAHCYTLSEAFCSLQCMK